MTAAMPQNHRLHVFNTRCQSRCPEAESICLSIVVASKFRMTTTSPESFITKSSIEKYWVTGLALSNLPSIMYMTHTGVGYAVNNLMVSVSYLPWTFSLMPLDLYTIRLHLLFQSYYLTGKLACYKNLSNNIIFLFFSTVSHWSHRQTCKCL